MANSLDLPINEISVHSDFLKVLQFNLKQEVQNLTELANYLNEIGEFVAAGRARHTLVQLQSTINRLTENSLLYWEPPSTDIVPQLVVADVHRLEGVGDDAPQGALAQLKGTFLGRFYISHVKKYGFVRDAALSLWRHGYPLYARYIAILLQRQEIKRWIPLISLDRATRSMDLARRLYCESECVTTPPPLVWPETDRGTLIAPHDQYDFPAISVVTVADCVVYGGTNIVYAQGSAICHDLYNFNSDYTSEELHGRQVIDNQRDAMRCLIHDDNPGFIPEAAVFVDACAPNYAHWITEVLSRVIIFCEMPGNDAVPIVVNDGLHQNLMESLSLIVGGRRKIIALPIGRAIKVSKLHITSVAGYVPFDRRGSVADGFSHGKFSAVAFSLLRQKMYSLIDGETKSAWPEKIYLRRNSGIRRVVNGAQLEEVLVNQGFVVVAPEKLTFIDQVRLFSRARIVVGSSGAAMANLIFTREDAVVCVLIGRLPDTSYWYWQNMARASAGCVRYVLGDIESEKSGIHSDFSVNVSDVLAAIAY